MSSDRDNSEVDAQLRKEIEKCEASVAKLDREIEAAGSAFMIDGEEDRDKLFKTKNALYARRRYYREKVEQKELELQKHKLTEANNNLRDQNAILERVLMQASLKIEMIESDVAPKAQAIRRGSNATASVLPPSRGAVQDIYDRRQVARDVGDTTGLEDSDALRSALAQKRLADERVRALLRRREEEISNIQYLRDIATLPDSRFGTQESLLRTRYRDLLGTGLHRDYGMDGRRSELGYHDDMAFSGTGRATSLLAEAAGQRYAAANQKASWSATSSLEGTRAPDYVEDYLFHRSRQEKNTERWAEREYFDMASPLARGVAGLRSSAMDRGVASYERGTRLPSVPDDSIEDYVNGYMRRAIAIPEAVRGRLILPADDPQYVLVRRDALADTVSPSLGTSSLPIGEDDLDRKLPAQDDSPRHYP